MLAMPALLAGPYPIDLRGLASALEQSVKLYDGRLPLLFFPAVNTVKKPLQESRSPTIVLI